MHLFHFRTHKVPGPPNNQNLTFSSPRLEEVAYYLVEQKSAFFCEKRAQKKSWLCASRSMPKITFKLHYNLIQYLKRDPKIVKRELFDKRTTNN